MTEEEWNAGWIRCLGVLMSGKTLNDMDRYGEPIRDQTFLLCMNPHHEHIQFYMPPCSPGSVVGSNGGQPRRGEDRHRKRLRSARFTT